MELLIDMLSTNFSHRAQLTLSMSELLQTSDRSKPNSYKLQINNAKNSEDGRDVNSYWIQCKLGA